MSQLIKDYFRLLKGKYMSRDQSRQIGKNEEMFQLSHNQCCIPCLRVNGVRNRLFSILEGKNGPEFLGVRVGLISNVAKKTLSLSTSPILDSLTLFTELFSERNISGFSDFFP